MTRKRKFIVFGQPDIRQEDIKTVVKTLKSGWIGTGPKTEEFEHKFAKYTHAKYALAVNSCTAGLHLALNAVGVRPGDEVITSPLTFPATVNVILHCGAKPVFVDVKPDGNMDPSLIEKKITKKTKVILPVHLYGRPCDMDKIMAIAKKNNLSVIEDAAHAIEAWYKNKKIGSIGDITVFSFYVTKNLTTAEGGMITTNNKKLADKMRILSLHGLSRDAYRRYSVKHFSHYQCLFPGYKYNLTDIASSIGIMQLKRIEQNLKTRVKQWNMYSQGLERINQITLPAMLDKSMVHARHLYTILINLEQMTVNRDQFIYEMIKRNVGAGVHFIPAHMHSFYRSKYGFKKGDYPKAEFIGDRTISLPLGPGFKTEDIKYVIKVLHEIVQRFSKKN
ncbi:UDP-4-amino-4,6-dideoxy-N-acetyl-beta-L-altrosamine transaminase [Candidatus Roizmanbacteria bacterium RIFCSPHIGHO2_02_FULL_37_13b]|uniref:UDP-4-amino-4, 6-dideoxy-N-acetyl-beta-L-altrosamine transaminase n=1 Tax=Candidatus Roizmanbacteria bacterium RIFCSPLOWO2_02_FULL_36_11 TaxID=1802071 RepID=A0A1F7JD39_9BACT|nr:MAG: UDP-4-amino-4,6-dideoxy-N-acetyl-beta-L-altrosamine transaminase [Candidatus Roizmanbacteria bacterium RIFCSPHIGHO2_02_FULL_37_13b]OGK53532.1 MAG: UDP-4-amino-4,6-dideoxy-N-acetyl-beta-L-altrosamine transaminase [Candidatus Roizmanbacteria bacterium RIFCSPLOWO2_02_FULL_36_11]